MYCGRESGIFVLTRKNVVDWYIMAQNDGGKGDSKPNPLRVENTKNTKIPMQLKRMDGEYF